MRRWFTLVLTCVLLLGCMPAMAAEEFTLRNGIKFGDTMDEVRAKETLEFKESSSESRLITVDGTVAGISGVSVEYFFDDDKKLKQVSWSLSASSLVDSSDSDYTKLYKAFVSKYGTPLGYDNGDCYIITGSALTGAALISYLYNSMDTGVGDLRDYAEWDYEYTNTDHVKIELVQYYYGSSYSTRQFHISVCYKHFTDADLEAAQQEKRNENEAVMNDI